MLLSKCKRVLTVMAVLCTFYVTAATETSVQRYFLSLRSLQAEFVQEVYDARSRRIDASSGRMFMQKPGRFRWDYEKPFAQVIVSDGQRLWHYDRELEQVTVRRLDTALSSTPLALLSGAAPIEEAFLITPSRVKEGLQWFELRPKDTQAEFKLLRVAFRGDRLDTIELEDTFEQRTRLQFRRLQRNVPIDPTLLRFVPPAGVDVVGDVPGSP